MATLLECARAVRPDVSPAAGPASGTALEAAGPVPADDASVPAPSAQHSPPGHGRLGPAPAAILSAREQEIARRVLTGLTYKEIGAQLFISAKTVEHHMARIRRRLGATSRRELFGQLQVMLHPE
jgi:DNA-binding CsgD family transcriptional regulator